MVILTPRIKPLIFIVLLGLSLLHSRSASAHRIEYSEFDPAPTGSVRVASPIVAWHVAPQTGSRVTAVKLFLNGLSVNAAYDTVRRAVWYVPTAPLKPGDYAVHCQATLDDEINIYKDWQFSVSASAVNAIDEPAKDQTALCDAVNALRRSLALPPVIVDNRLCAAAAGHSAYLARTRGLTHQQTVKQAGFVGEHVEDRVHAFGYAGACYEGISQGSAGTAAVRCLFDAPYHRAPFLQPGDIEAGAGVSSGVVTLLFGSSAASGVVTYPVDGQSNVPVRWSGVETPNPLRMYAAVNGSVVPTGYVISLFSFSADDLRLVVSKATLTTTDGKPVACYVNTPDNDDFLHNGVLIIPRQPLTPGTTYRVAVQATDESGADRSRTWSFRTASASNASIAIATR